MSNNLTRGVSVSGKWSFVLGRSSPVDFGAIVSADFMDFNLHFRVDFNADFKDFCQNLPDFTDSHICLKLRFRLITKYRSFVVNERPIKSQSCSPCDPDDCIETEHS